MSRCTRQELEQRFKEMREHLTKPHDEYDFSTVAILKVLEADSVVLRGITPQTIWPLQRRYWIDQTRSEVGSGLVDPTGPDRLADLVDPDQYQIDLVGTSHWYRGQVLVGKVQHS